jgi:nicotinamide-nucleotide amidase
MKQPQVLIVSTGSELTNGKSQDTNSMWIANELVSQGFSIRKILVLPDDPNLIQEELLSATKMGNLDWIILTGGLGPTDDDYTVDVVLKLTDDVSMFVEKARFKLEKIYRLRGLKYESILDTAFRQTRVPEKSLVMDNKVGIAPGFVVPLSIQTRLACMPGVPSEMKDIFTKKLLPLMIRTSKTQAKFRGERVIWNIGESLYQEEFIRNQPLLQNDSVEWGVTAKRGYIKTTFLSEDQSIVDKILSDLDIKYKDRISGDIFPELHRILIDKKYKISIAESCTGGWVAKILTDMAGSSAYFISSLVTYHNLAKENLLFVPQETLNSKGAVSEETAKAMLSGLEKHFNIDYSLSITGIAGPDGGTSEKPVGLVYVGVKKKGRPARIIKYFFPGNREMVRESAANNAIFQLYREILL